VDIGAFRTYPAGYSPPNASASEYQSIPLNKIEDFGVHANQYYSLDVQIFKSSLDTELLGLLWNKYWVNTLSQSPLISNRAYAASQLTDLHQKLTKAASNVPQTKPIVPPLPPGEKGSSSKVRELHPLDACVGSDTSRPSQKSESKKDVENQLAKAVKDSTKIAMEAQHGLIAQVIKDVLFSSRPGQVPSQSVASTEETVEMAIG
jgi:COP9 signalosome complex subunit 5